MFPCLKLFTYFCHRNFTEAVLTEKNNNIRQTFLRHTGSEDCYTVSTWKRGYEGILIDEVYVMSTSGAVGSEKHNWRLDLNTDDTNEEEEVQVERGGETQVRVMSGKTWGEVKEVMRQMQDRWRKSDWRETQRNRMETEKRRHKNTENTWNRNERLHKWQERDRKSLLLEPRETLRRDTPEPEWRHVLWTVLENLTRVLNKEIHSPAAVNNFNTTKRRKDLIIHVTLESAHIWSIEKWLIHVNCYRLLY